MTAGVLKKQKKAKKRTKGSRDHFLIRQNKTMQIFEGIFFFKATNKKKHKQLLPVVRQTRAHIRLEEAKRQQLSYMFVFVLIVAVKKKIPSQICVLSCFVCFLA